MRPPVITQHGKPAAVLLDVSAHEDLLAQIEVLQDIRTAERQLDEGLGIPHRRALAEAIRRGTSSTASREHASRS